MTSKKKNQSEDMKSVQSKSTEQQQKGSQDPRVGELDDTDVESNEQIQINPEDPADLDDSDHQIVPDEDWLYMLQHHTFDYPQHLTPIYQNPALKRRIEDIIMVMGKAFPTREALSFHKTIFAFIAGTNNAQEAGSILDNLLFTVDSYVKKQAASESMTPDEELAMTESVNLFLVPTDAIFSLHIPVPTYFRQHNDYFFNGINTNTSQLQSQVKGLWWQHVTNVAMIDKFEVMKQIQESLWPGEKFCDMRAIKQIDTASDLIDL